MIFIFHHHHHCYIAIIVVTYSKTDWISLVARRWTVADFARGFSEFGEARWFSAKRRLLLSEKLRHTDWPCSLTSSLENHEDIIVFTIMNLRVNETPQKTIPFVGGRTADGWSIVSGGELRNNAARAAPLWFPPGSTPLRSECTIALCVFYSILSATRNVLIF